MWDTKRSVCGLLHAHCLVRDGFVPCAVWLPAKSQKLEASDSRVRNDCQ